MIEATNTTLAEFNLFQLRLSLVTLTKEAARSTK